MNLLRLFGIRSESILAKGHCVSGMVTDVYRCWWLRINTKPIRRFSGDGAVYPHIITFEYPADGTACIGKLYIPVRYRVPRKGEKIEVYVDPADPRKYACYAFGPANNL